MENKTKDAKMTYEDAFKEITAWMGQINDRVVALEEATANACAMTEASYFFSLTLAKSLIQAERIQPEQLAETLREALDDRKNGPQNPGAIEQLNELLAGLETIDDPDAPGHSHLRLVPGKTPEDGPGKD